MQSVIRRYLVVFEKNPATFRGFAPDVPVCAQSALSLEDLRERMHDAIEAYLRGLMNLGRPIPEPSMGPEDVVHTNATAEWMVVRLRNGEGGAKHMIVRPFPSREQARELQRAMPRMR